MSGEKVGKEQTRAGSQGCRNSQGHLLVPWRRASGLEHPKHHDSGATSTSQRQVHGPDANPYIEPSAEVWQEQVGMAAARSSLPCRIPRDPRRKHLAGQLHPAAGAVPALTWV